MTNQHDADTPLACAHRTNMLIKAIYEQDGPDLSYEIDRNLQRIAAEHARRGDFKSALTAAKELHYEFMIIRTLMDIACEMLKAGEEAVALKTIDFAWEKCREPENGFPEVNLLPYLATLKSCGHEKLVLSILRFALARIELMDSGEFRLNCYTKMLPYLAVYCRESAEKIVDTVLALPSGIPGTRDEFQYSSLEALFDIALAISTFDLNWNQERQQLFCRSMEFNRQITLKKCGEDDFNLIETVQNLMEERSPMRIDFPDFHRFRMASRGDIVVSKVRAFGDDKDRAAGSMNEALKMLTHYQGITSAIVIISGASDSIKTDEYQAVMDLLQARIPEDAKVLATVVDDESLSGDFEVTVLLEECSHARAQG